jgi:1-acyl-sn-glycerol-3-phosphate acyltransferase
MFVANHNSWMDIPFMGITVGWRNYKLISKAELGKVPILGKAIALGGHVMVDRSDRKSQLKTLKLGMQWLKVSESEYNSNITVCYSTVQVYPCVLYCMFCVCILEADVV